MTVIVDDSPKVKYVGPFSIGELLPLTFPYDRKEDVKMKIGTVDAIYNVDYEIITEPSPEHPVPTPNSATLKRDIDAGVQVTIYRMTPLDQQSEFPQNARFPSERIEEALDKICMEQQEQEERLSRCIIAPITLNSFNGQLPEPIPGRGLIWSPDGAGFVNTEFDLSAEGMVYIINVSNNMGSIINCSTHMIDIINAPENADKARIYAEGTDAEVEAIGGTHSAKRFAEMFSHVEIASIPSDESVDVLIDPEGDATQVGSALSIDGRNLSLLSEEDEVMSTVPLPEYQPIGDYATNTALANGLAQKQNTISDLATIRSNATNGQLAYTASQSYGNIVTYNASNFATAAQGAKADSALQSINSTMVVNALGFTPYSNANPSGYQTATQVNNAITSATSSFITKDVNNLTNYTTTTNLNTLLAGKQSTISDLEDIREGAELGATAVQPDDISEYTANEVQTLWESL